MSNRTDFLFPCSRYHGSDRPENLIFNAHLQEFSQRLSLISALQTNGKLSTEEALKQIQTLWQQLERSKNLLDLGNSPGAT